MAESVSLELIGLPTTYTWTTTSLTVTGTRTKTSTTVSTATSSSLTSTTGSTVTTTPWPASLLCWALIVPWTGEVALIGMQSNLNASIFDCDDYSMFSDRVMEIGGHWTQKIPNTDLNAGWDPATQTAQNTWIFHNAWRLFLDEGKWLHHDWVIKVDADAVFLPSRLRAIARDPWVGRVAREGNGVFLNNCKFGLHGPIEVFSRLAMETYNKSWHWCSLVYPQEDVYIKKCMWSSGVRQVDAFTTLAEQHCDEPWFWNCQGSYVSYHPFKDPAQW
eukprot:CAMPEP_0197659982 /NCGR_PEP_ID=MMETSP1338-20131121/49961_1 /TAXON_ID=43686 ORGANISM="Pelagodinium beii, Strain RCC1491" /NCGR_SAMPLE_ID=MMETSP1338 /ASSEMBLY_ACC=CAM_ASM_000754 /LENGTH=274 /DNA_ID=CAMNT_0043237199 /DNA_START=236 /DNA_END=1057 /DNA_ORIENTATION=+